MQIRRLLGVSMWFLCKCLTFGYRFPALLRLGAQRQHVTDHDLLEVLDTSHWLQLNSTYDLSFHLAFFDHSMSSWEFTGPIQFHLLLTTSACGNLR